MKSMVVSGEFFPGAHSSRSAAGEAAAERKPTRPAACRPVTTSALAAVGACPPMEGTDRTFLYVFDLLRESSFDTVNLPQTRPRGRTGRTMRRPLAHGGTARTSEPHPSGALPRRAMSTRSRGRSVSISSLPSA